MRSFKQISRAPYLSDHETLQIEQAQSLKKQTSIVNFLSYEGVTESEDSSSKESDNNIIPEQYETSSELSTISPSEILNNSGSGNSTVNPSDPNLYAHQQYVVRSSVDSNIDTNNALDEEAKLFIANNNMIKYSKSGHNIRKYKYQE
ncbi:5588_t:CDS:2 [Gigaspora rosea]|nr:5588_t:CDS:2 [Gigaspora rosea]